MVYYFFDWNGIDFRGIELNNFMERIKNEKIINSWCNNEEVDVYTVIWNVTIY